ncbi:restriction endonuclease [Nocardia asteroides NBRC 15531]|uniref:Endonuclease n=1 Tax=Nocardia asteroides NBRC 15531 TaxID=1110697 RepID=U5E4V7_NOCAS|nr:NgoMIV family type II restriction endonuclease [Nocardia asteroides]TLF70571.1 restriction endonuclease [Nocardia asteroides NBRC 15531]UGT50139.1 restriction endonuclease [Nocardia asteroides]SFN20121.1 NgoMIV restriction enzyme [Nocardia asteroides]VEG37093.1 Type-2 restriction enzyme NgoMIV [Nocardia asteroides]GAD81850.1 putative endonuclease [Nocardia asteroides NBRC 15531]
MGMTFGTDLLGWKRSRKNKLGWQWVPNTADTDSVSSLRLSAAVLEYLAAPNPNGGASDPVEPPDNPGGLLETQVATDLATELPRLDPERKWEVRKGQSIVNYAQYQHLAAIDRAIANDPNLRVTLGTDYLIKPDVLVGLLGTPTATEHPWLHAALACKWTIRSDRVQNIRHENGNMIRHRRGRLPHLVTVTAEPLPTRLASIARGTGEVDATYHLAFPAMNQAVAAVGTGEQQDAWAEVTEQGRLLDYTQLAASLATW